VWFIPDAYSVNFTGIQWRVQGSSDSWQEVNGRFGSQRGVSSRDQLGLPA
jgi:hypothetical protein